MTVLWSQTQAADETPEAVEGSYDVAVVGAGLTGLAAALLLARAGRRVIVLEAREVGAGTTGRSSAKLSLLQGTRLSQISGRQGPDLARQYVEGNGAALDWLLAECGELGVAVQRRAAVTYAAGPEQVAAARAEYDAAAAAGLPVRWRTDLPVPRQGCGWTTRPSWTRWRSCGHWPPKHGASGYASAPTRGFATRTALTTPW